jgi:ArsR family transcriptional regulator
MNMNSYDCCSEKDLQSKKVGELSSLLKVISDNSRLQILCILQKKELCVCELIEATNLSQSLISHHLKDLKDADLVSKRIDGKWSRYSLTPKGQKITNLIFKIKL